jgi:uncharacterized delta-60 repeat protein
MKNKFINTAFIFMAIGLIYLSSFAASAGSLDSSFGVAGKVLTRGNIIVGPQDIAFQNDGKIVGVGWVGSNFGVARYNANGNLDTSFDGDGIVSTDFGGSDDARDVVVQSDGKIVVCGVANTNNTGIARYNSNGSLDLTFDGDGIQAILNARCVSLAIQPDGKVIGTGNLNNANHLVFRLNLNGSFDTTFGTNGFVSTTLSGGFGDVKVQNDGKIVVVGSLLNPRRTLFARYNPNGSLDTTFSGDGFLEIDLATVVFGEAIQNISIDSVDNSIYGVGILGDFLSAVKVTSDGILDTTFDGDGHLEFKHNGIRTGGQSVTIQSDRKIVISAVSFSSPAFILLLRRNPNGTPDATFGNNGVSITNVQPSTAAIGPSGNIAIYGDKLIVGLEPSELNGFQISRHNLANTPTASSDFDGDGVTDSAVFRPATGQWFALRSTDNSTGIFQFGLNGDVPIDGDFDGDGRNDLAVFRPSSSEWFFQQSSDATTLTKQFGQTGDKPSPGDYDKDGVTDITFFRPDNANWFTLKSSTKFTTASNFQFGLNGDIPISSEQK